MSTSTQPISHSTQNAPTLKHFHQSPPAASSPVHNNNNTSYGSNKVSKTSIYISPKSKTTIIELSESDEAEVVEILSPPKKLKAHKHKHNKKHKESGDRSAPHVRPLSTMIPTTDLTSDEIDHNQIIHDLKVNNPLNPRKKHVHFQL